MSNYCRTFLVWFLCLGMPLVAQVAEEKALSLLNEAIISPMPALKQAIYNIGRPIIAMAPVDTHQEIQVGERMQRAIANQLGWRLDLPGTDLDYVRAVGARIAKNCRRKGVPYTFHLVELPEINAFTHAGGHVYVCRGIFSHLDNEAQLASLLGHEIAHEDLTHTQDMVRPVTAAHRIQSLFPEARVDFVRLIAGLGALSMHLVYSEPRELEADSLGMQLAYEGSYDPREAISLYQTHGNNQAQKAPTSPAAAAFQSHPNGKARLAAMHRNAADLFKARPYGPKLLGVEAFRKRRTIELP